MILVVEQPRDAYMMSGHYNNKSLLDNTVRIMKESLNNCGLLSLEFLISSSNRTDWNQSFSGPC